MGMNDTPSGERIHIGFFGRRNAGKSSVVNAFTNQELAVVSDTPGTTTDPVYKSMELLPLGPVMIIDTAGFDDEGTLGEMRVKKTMQVLNKTDCAVLVTDCTKPLGDCERELISLFEKKKIPYITVKNKTDLLDTVPPHTDKEFYVSALEKTNINELRERVANIVDIKENSRRIVGDIIKQNDLIVLVIPIDKAAPKGRLILPQQQTIRDILESGASAVTVRETELAALLENIGTKPKLVITDSQVFGAVNKIVPKEIKLTSFSILMARYKGFLESALKGAAAIDKLNDGDKIMISEGCTHHRQCGDIGSVKLPDMLKKYTGKSFDITLTSGREFPEDLSGYKLVIHCGGCMLGAKEMIYRMNTAGDCGVPFTNYGVALAYMQGILKRTVEMLPEAELLLNK